jgi:unsaturated rhamnogalacturonyl hydrolase
MLAVSRIVLAVTICLAVAHAEKRAVGLTAEGTLIEATAIRGASPKLPTVVFIGDLSGSNTEAVHDVERETARFEAMAQSRRRLHLLTIATANPSRVKLTFPPSGVAYRDNPESHYLWRWIGLQAPDLVIVADTEDFGLTQALQRNPVAGIGSIPSRHGRALQPLAVTAPSEARREMNARLARTPRQVAEELSHHYGKALDDAVYIPAVALIGRNRLGHVTDVQKIVSAYVDGSTDSLRKPTSSHMSGHLIFADLAERTRDSRYVELVRKAADLGFSDWNEMSDGVFMGCPILAKAGKLTGDRKYFDRMLEHYRYMTKLCLRADGIYRHSPLDESAWGRGNAFPALGLALALADIPRDHPAYPELLAGLRSHLAALIRFQDESGMWRQVIDKAGSYREFSATAMIGTAITRAVRSGWVDAKAYQPRAEAAWRGILARTRDGIVVDVCESTGKQKSLTDYLRRVAILDRDPRGGAMALLFATEMAGLQ